MARYNLSDTYETDVAVNFRYEVVILVNDEAAKLNHLQDSIVGYASSAEIPCAPMSPIEWYLPMGMLNHQPGKRKTKEVRWEFVVPTTDALQKRSIYYMLENWSNSTYNLNRGTNRGKALTCTDGLFLRLRTERDGIAYAWQLLRAMPTEVDYGSVNAEGNELVKVSATFVYDNYKVFDNAGTLLNEDATAYS